jgi:hypothetical protein
MNKILIAFAASAALFSLGACKKKGGAGEAIAKVEEFSKKMCECKDKACGDKVNDEYTKWGQEMAKTAKPEDAKSVSAEDTKKMTEAATKYSECFTKLAMGDVKAPDAKPDEVKADTAKPDEVKADTAKPDEAKPDEAKKDEAKPDEAKKDEAKPDEAKKDEPKKDEAKKDDAKKGGW